MSGQLHVGQHPNKGSFQEGISKHSIARIMGELKGLAGDKVEWSCGEVELLRTDSKAESKSSHQLKACPIEWNSRTAPASFLVHNRDSSEASSS